jgi:hypothetical protein
MRCSKFIWLAIIAVALAPPLAAAPVNGSVVVTDISAQRVAKKKRPQIRVTPRYPRVLVNTPYPLPYRIHYPGPDAKRECVARLVEEHRPSGTVVAPWMRCWWVRG